MSETKTNQNETTETTETVSPETVEAVFERFAEGLKTKALAVVKKGTELARARLALGAECAKALAGMIGEGVAEGDAQTRILAGLADVMGPEDAPTSWATVKGWNNSHAVAQTLPAELRSVFGVEGLAVLGRVPLAEDQDDDDKRPDRVSFARELAEKGRTGDRAVRAEKEKTYGSATKTEKTAKSSSAIVKALGGVAEKTRETAAETLAGLGVEWSPALQDVLDSFTILGVRIGKGGATETKGERNAAEELGYMGPAEGETETEKTETA